MTISCATANPDPAPADPPAAVGISGAVLVTLFLLGYYLNFDIPVSAGVYVPAGVAGLCGLALLIRNIGRMQRHDLPPLAMLLVIPALTVLCNPPIWTDFAFRSYAGEYAKSYLVFLYAVPAAYGVYLELSAWRLAALRRLFAAVLVLVLAGCVLEILTPLRQLSDAVRPLLFNPDLVYMADARDIALYGIVRPKLFTAEPSDIAKFFLFMMCLLLVTAERPRDWMLAGALAILGLAVVRSPIAYLLVPLALVFPLARSVAHGKATLGLLSTAALVVVAVPLFAWIGMATIGGRVDLWLQARDVSFDYRLLGPLLVLLEVLAEYPLLGLGFGAKEVGIPIALDVYLEADVPLAVLSTAAPLGNNAAISFLIQMGIVGGIAFAIALWRTMRWLSGRLVLYAAVACLAAMNTEGANNSLRLWGFFFMMFAVCQAWTAAQVRIGGPSGLPE